MAQQRIKFVLKRDSADTNYTTTVEADTNTLTAQPVALDAEEDFRLIVEDDLTEAEVADKVQHLISALRDGRLVLDAAVA